MLKRGQHALLLLGIAELPEGAFVRGCGRAPATLEDFSGGGRGGTRTATETNISTVNEDRRQVTDAGAVSVQSAGATTVQLTDTGAVRAAIDLAKTSSDTIQAGVSEVLGFAKDVLKVSSENLKGTQTAFQQSTEAVKGAFVAQADISTGQRAMVAGGLILAGIVAIKALGKGD